MADVPLLRVDPQAHRKLKQIAKEERRSIRVLTDEFIWAGINARKPQK